MIEAENLRLAFWKASRGKRCRDDQRAYEANLGAELEKMRDGLIDGTYPVGRYERFTVYEPKERIICAAAFSERVLHHALMNVIEPWLEKWLIFDIYACRKGKGQLRAVKRAQAFAHCHTWFLKCDFRKYFDSIPQDGLMRMVERRFKDKKLIDWIGRIIVTYETTPGHGLPIGNLTSQHLANLYLDPLDRLLPGVPYVRYMDDFVFWADEKDTLKKIRAEVLRFAEVKLGLSLKGEPSINRTSHGMDFLGMRVFPDVIRLNRASKKRYMGKASLYARLFDQGLWNEQGYQERITALTAFTQQADATAWRRSFFSGIGDKRRGTTACCAAGAGTTMRRTAVLPTGTTTTRPTRTTTTASASSHPQHRKT